jgi:ATP-dependent Clp protease ATP-binding subunit ClpC
MFERYREDARRAIFFSRWEAQQSGSAYIEPEHLLLSLAHDADSKANQLFALSSHPDNFRRQLRPHPPTKSSTFVDLPLSNTSKRVLTYAAQEADRLASNPIGTEHLLLGLLREKKIRRARAPGSSRNRSSLGKESNQRRSRAADD